LEYPNTKYKCNCWVCCGEYSEPYYTIFDKLKFFFQNKKLISSWEKIFDIKILDPDGWDKTDPYLRKRYYTQEEFEIASCYSTCEFDIESVNFLYKNLYLQEAKERWDIIVNSMKNNS
jgi:hypothetical protein